MDKKTNTFSNKIAKARGWIQAAATLLTNIHLPNLWKGKIYQGNAKTVCVPGLNCYSCPAAAGACPIGAFQAVVGSSKFQFSYYITGFFIFSLPKGVIRENVNGKKRPMTDKARQNIARNSFLAFLTFFHPPHDGRSRNEHD